MQTIEGIEPSTHACMYVRIWGRMHLGLSYGVARMHACTSARTYVPWALGVVLRDRGGLDETEAVSVVWGVCYEGYGAV